jgi:hypothetical protein
VIADSRVLRIKIRSTNDCVDLQFIQGKDGRILGSDSWLIPFSQEDHILISKSNNISPLEWMYQRLLTFPFVSAEIIDE